MSVVNENQLGAYLKDRRTKLDPLALGLPSKRRRTPGLRREEVAQRANVSATWYTWLEQGRGGAPSANVLDRIAHALLLTDLEREHIFLLALGRPPEVRYRVVAGVAPRIQRVLEALEYSPSLIKTFIWDIVSWNRAAAAVLGDGKHGLPEQTQYFAQTLLRSAVTRQTNRLGKRGTLRSSAFRADVARAGASKEVEVFVEEMRRRSPEFEKIWRDNDVREHGDGLKHLQHPLVGVIALEYSAFAVDGRPDLSMVIYQPATPADKERIKTLMNHHAETTS